MVGDIKLCKVLAWGAQHRHGNGSRYLAMQGYRNRKIPDLLKQSLRDFDRSFIESVALSMQCLGDVSVVHRTEQLAVRTRFFGNLQQQAFQFLRTLLSTRQMFGMGFFQFCAALFPLTRKV